MKSPIPVSYATCSLGKPSRQSSLPLPLKLSAIAEAGFSGIELSFPDLLGFARASFTKEDIKEDDWDTLCAAGQMVKQLCDAKNLKVMMLQPFSNFEGWPEGSPERDEAFRRAAGWIQIMKAVGTDMLQVGSSDSTGIVSFPEVLAYDLGKLADMLAVHSLRLAYENWCWATHAPTWRDVWLIIQLANRPNIGLCLDTFQIAGFEWADPTSVSGLIADRAEADRVLEKSLAELARTVPKDSIYLLQISDAYRVESPLRDEPEEKGGLRARGVWSHSHRPLPFDGGYLPVVQVTKAVLKTGFRGWFSTEVFDEKTEDDVTVQAQKAIKAHHRLLKECGI